MSEILYPERDLQQRQDAVLEAALKCRRHHLALHAGGPAAATGDFVASLNALFAAADALQAWHNENGR